MAHGQTSSNSVFVDDVESQQHQQQTSEFPPAYDTFPGPSDTSGTSRVEEDEVNSHIVGASPFALMTGASPSPAISDLSSSTLDLEDKPNPRLGITIEDRPYSSFVKPPPTFPELIAEYGVLGGFVRIIARFLKSNWGILLFLLFISIGLTLLGTLAFSLTWKGWCACVVLCLTLTLLIANAFVPAIVMTMGLTAMLVLDLVTPEKALEGFSNSGVITVAILFVVAEGVQRTSVLVPLFRFILGKPRNLWLALIRVMIPVALISAFLNNTPVVVMLIPVVQNWSRRANFPVSKILMPLNNAAILGGTLTLLGTSTNLVVDGLAKKSGLLVKDGKNVGLPIFGITPVGAVVLVAGLLYMLLFSQCLLRDRGQTGATAIIRNPREYTVALVVDERAPIVGETVTEAGLRQLRGLYLVELTRKDGTIIPAVDPDTKLEGGDGLLFAGVVETVTELYHIHGLKLAAGQSHKMKIERHERRLVELVISASSMLCGKTAKESRFRTQFQAAIIAVHRQGEHIKEKIGDIKFRAGDTLLVETGPEFVRIFGKDSTFALVSEVTGSQPPREDRLHMFFSAAIVITMVGLATAEVLPLLTASALASFLMIATGCLTFSAAARAVDLQVIITIAASFGISNGMEETGAAAALAQFIMNIFEPIGRIGLLLGIYVATAMLSSVITNNAAVALMFPVIQSILKSNESSTVDDKLRTLYALMIGASSSFSTPIGYQTNLMVHGPGGYTFMDWVVFGIPLQFVLALSGVFALNFMTFSL